MSETRESMRIGAPPAPGDAPPVLVVKPKRMRWEIPITVAAVGVLLVLGVSVASMWKSGSATPTPTPTPTSTSTLGNTMNVRGGVALTFGQYALSGQRCFGRGGYDDITPGAQVKVTDATGKVIALGAITYGVVTDSDSGKVKDACLMFFEIDNVPRFGKFYGVEVAHRGIVQATEQEMISGVFTLSIG